MTTSPTAHLDENDAVRLLLEPAAAGRDAARRHLDDCEPCRALVATVAKLVIESRDDDPVTRGWVDEGPAPGDEVGAFRILQRIGQGSMGTVYLAQDDRLHRRVALKLLGARTADEGALRRARAEARSMARLHHPNVLEVFDVGQGAHGPFVAMQYVDGTDLRQWLTATSRPVDEILQKLQLAGAGLAAAHAAGVVHRDFKPANVLVGRDGSVRVADFGLAVLRTDVGRVTDSLGTPTSGSAHDVSASTRSRGTIAGTPAYMAPEQVQGANATPAADQFAFCVTAFEALTGRRPFDETTLEARQTAIDAGRMGPMEPTTPRWARAALRRGLHVDPARRFTDMPALLAALRPPARRATAVWATVALGAAALGISAFDRTRDACADLPVALNWTDGDRASMQDAWRSRTIDPLTATRLLDALDRYANDWAAVRDTTCRPDDPHQRDADAARCLSGLHREFEAFMADAMRARAEHAEGFARATNKLLPTDRCLDGHTATVRDPTLDARTNELRAEYRSAQARSDGDAMVALRPRVAETAARAVAIGDASVEAEMSHMLGVLHADRGDFAGSSPWFQRAFFVAQGAGHDQLAFDAALAQSMIAGADPRRLDEAWTWDRHARAALAQIDDRDGRIRLRIHEGSLYTAAGDDDKAGEALHEAEAWLGDDLPEYVPIELYCELGQHLARKEDREGCRDAFGKAIAHGEATLGPDHPELLRPLNGIATCEMMLGAHGDAQRHLERVIILAERTGNDLVEAMANGNLGLLYRNLEQPTACLAALQRADALFGTLYADDHIEVARSAANVAAALLNAGRFDEAVEGAARAERLIAAQPIDPGSLAYAAELTHASARVMRGDPRMVPALEQLVRDAPTENYRVEASIGHLQALLGEGRDDEVVAVGVDLYRDDAPTPAMSELRYAEGRLSYAIALRHTGNPEEYRRQLEVALRLAEQYAADDPRDVVGRIRRALQPEAVAPVYPP